MLWTVLAAEVLDVKLKGRTYRDPWSGLAVNEVVQTGVALHLRVTANHAPTSPPDSNQDEPTSSHVVGGGLDRVQG